MTGVDEVFHATRVLAGAVDAFVGQVYFAPEAHVGDVKLGFSDSPGCVQGVAMPDMAASFCPPSITVGH